MGCLGKLGRGFFRASGGGGALEPGRLRRLGGAWARPGRGLGEAWGWARLGWRRMLLVGALEKPIKLYQKFHDQVICAWSPPRQPTVSQGDVFRSVLGHALGIGMINKGIGFFAAVLVFSWSSWKTSIIFP